METIVNYFLYFIIYSFLGWSMEVICKLIERRKFVDRGFLVGPICPIYGYGVLFIVLLVGSPQKDILAVFLKAILICSILEYLTSYLMEKIFKARWWDYSSKKYNINGRICLETMIPFGILGVLVVYIIHPFIINITNILSSNVRLILAIILFIIYLFDNIFSFTILKRIGHEIRFAKKDNTESIKKYIDKWINNNTIFYRRIKSSYPNFHVSLKKINEEVKKTKKKFQEEEKRRRIKYKNKIKKLKENK